MKREEDIKEILNSFHAIKKIIISESRQSPGRCRLTHSQALALDVIAHNENISIKKIADFFRISSSAATQLVDSLVKIGFTIREQDENDRRQLRIRLSGKAHKYVGKLREKGTVYMTRLFAGLSDSELSMYKELNNKIISSAERKRKKQK